MLTPEMRTQMEQDFGPVAQPQSIQPSVSTSDDEVTREIARLRLLRTPPKEEGFLKTLVKETIKPFAQIGVSAYNVGAQTLETGKSLLEGKDQAKNEMVSRKLPFLGETKPAFTGEETTGQAAEKMAGYGAEVGSWVVGGGGAKNILGKTLKGEVLQGLKTGTKMGALSGALAGGGRAAEEMKSPAEVATDALVGGAFGAAIGAPLGAAAPIVGKGIKKVLQPIEGKVSDTIKEAIDKGIKPYFKGNRTPEMTQRYYKNAEEAFKLIKKYSPEITSEEEGMKIIKNPENRKEMLEALNEVKKKIYQEYHRISTTAGEGGARYNPRNIMGELLKIADPNNKRYTPEIRSYASQLLEEVGELTGQTPEIIESRIQDLNQSLAGYFDGRVTKTKAQIDASVANMMRRELDQLIEKTTGEAYQPLKSSYSALKTIEQDLARQVNLEARRNTRSLVDFTDIFTGGDLMAGIVTQNPALLLRGLAGKGIKEFTKYLNDPNRYIKKAFDVLDESAKVPKGSNILSRANEKLKPYAGLTTRDISTLTPTERTAQGLDLLDQIEAIANVLKSKKNFFVDAVNKGKLTMDEWAELDKVSDLIMKGKAKPAVLRNTMELMKKAGVDIADEMGLSKVVPVGETALIQEAKIFKITGKPRESYPGLDTVGKAKEKAAFDNIENNFDSIIKKWASLEDSKGGRLINVDDFRSLVHDEAKFGKYIPSEAQTVHEPVSALGNYLKKQKIDSLKKDDIVGWMAGAPGHGKGTAIRNLDSKLYDNMTFGYDSVMANPIKTAADIQAVLDKGGVNIIDYVFRGIEDGWLQGVIGRAKGPTRRTLPLNVYLKGAEKAWKTIIENYEKFSPNPRNRFNLINNLSSEKNKAFFTTIEEVKKLNYTDLEKRYTDKLTNMTNDLVKKGELSPELRDSLLAK